MGEFIKIFTNYSYQWIVALFFSFLSYMARKFYNVYKVSVENNRIAKEKEIETQKEMAKKESKEQALMKYGVLALLRFRVNRLCALIKDQKYMTIDQKLDLIDLYKAYEALGGNSRTHLLYEEIIKYEVRAV